MSPTLNQVIQELVRSSPTCESTEVKNDLNALLTKGHDSLVNQALQTHLQTLIFLTEDSRIVSPFNKDKSTGKYWHHARGEKFSYDFDSASVCNVEAVDLEPAVSKTLSDLTPRLRSYGNEYYPSQYGFEIVPGPNGSFQILIIGKKANKSNFYTGSWVSRYNVSEQGAIDFEISLDIHYYEDGNVRLNYTKKSDSSIKSVSADNIVKFLKDTEDRLTLELIDKFLALNQDTFKNLRRLLPVTKSKINWGKAIGTYKLGEKVVNSS